MVINIPAEVLDSWPAPNYVNPETRGPFLSILVYVFFVVIPIIVGARIYSRTVILKRWGLDDWIFIVAVVPIVGFDICCILAAHQYYFDHHIWDVPPDIFVPATKIIWGGELLFHLASSFLKISILFFYRRLILTDVSRKWLNIIRITIVINVTWLIVFFVVMVCACRPLSAFWEHTSPLYFEKDYVCLDQSVYWPFNGVLSLLTDMLTVILPVCMIAQMKISRRQKKQLFWLFSIGMLAVVAGVFRLIFTIRPLIITYDMFWEAYSLCVASVLELNLGLVLASVPALKAFFSNEDFAAEFPSSFDSQYSSTTDLKPGSSEKFNAQKEVHSDHSSEFSEKRTDEADSEPSPRTHPISEDFTLATLSLGSPQSPRSVAPPVPQKDTPRGSQRRASRPVARPAPGQRNDSGASVDSVSSMSGPVSSMTGPVSAARSSFRFSIGSWGMSHALSSKRSPPPAPLFFGDRGECPPNVWR